MVPDPTGPYSVGMVANGLLFVAGQRPVRKSDGKIPESFADQVSQSLDNMEHVLMQVGCDLGDIVKITAYLANLEDFSKLNDVFRARLPEPFPARTTVGVSLRGVLVELDAYAVVRPEALPEHGAPVPT